MTEAITTGTVAQSGTSLYLVGTASDLDTSALVDAAYNQKVAAADSIDVRIEDNQSEIEAYKTLQDLGNDLTSALEKLKSSYGYSSADQSVYNTMTSYISATDGSDVSNIVSVDVEDDAIFGNYNLEIIQLATAMKTTSDSMADKTTDLNMDGTFSIALESESTVDIIVTSDMSLQDLANAINGVSEQSGVNASIVKTSDNEYTMVLTGLETGYDINTTHIAGDNVFQSLGLIDTNGDFVNIAQTAQSALIELDGIEVTSHNNTLENIMDGVSLTLYAEQVGTNMTLEIDYDYSATKDAIIEFVDAYNALRDFVIQNQQYASDGSVSEDAVLFSNTILKSLNNQASDILTSIFNSGDVVNNLGDLGITFDDDNKLEVSDETTLNNALLNNYDGIQSLFQTAIETDNDNISLIRNASTLSSIGLTLDILTDGNGDITSVTANGDNSAFEISGALLTGKSGTIYEGLTFAYIGGSTTTINISINQGMADRLYNAVDSYTNTTNGIIQSSILNIESASSQLDTQADRIRERADAFRAREILRYARMETEIQAAETLLKTVRALLGTSDD